MNNNLIEFVTKDGSRRSIGPNDIKGLRFNFLGENNHIVIHEGTTFSDCSMSLIKDSYIEIGASQYLINKLYLFANQSRIEIGTDFSCWGVEINVWLQLEMIACFLKKFLFILQTAIRYMISQLKRYLILLNLLSLEIMSGAVDL